MLAFAMMAAIRHRANPMPFPKTKRETTNQRQQCLTTLDPLVGLEIRCIAMRLAQRRIQPIHIVARLIWWLVHPNHPRANPWPQTLWISHHNQSTSAKVVGRIRC
jgi:hypothetical protein